MRMHNEEALVNISVAICLCHEGRLHS